MVPMRFVRANSAIYLRQEDVIEYLRNIAATEETDTRNRLEKVGDVFFGVGKPPLEDW